MQMTLREKYGGKIGFLILVFFAVWGVSLGAHESQDFWIFFPLDWLELTPVAGIVEDAVDSYGDTTWWLVLDVLLSVFTWLLIFYVLRGLIYKVTGLEGPSMWVLFALCIFAGFAFIVYVITPAMQELGGWWEERPGERLEHPDG